MSKLSSILAQKVAENTQRHATAGQEASIDLGRQHTKIRLDLIDPNPYQPRIEFDEAEIKSLALSIETAGLLQPISVRMKGDRYQLIAGERRLRASKMLGLHSIEAIVVPVDEADMAILALAENIDRKDLSDYEIGQAIRNIEEMFPSRTELAESLGMNRQDLYRYLAFDDLPMCVLERLAENPRLMGRSAATQLRSALNECRDINVDPDEILPPLLDALEAGTMDQNKLAKTFKAQVLQHKNDDNPDAGTNLPVSRLEDHFEHAGQRVGLIRRDARNITIKIKTSMLTDEQQQRLVEFIRSELQQDPT